MYKTQSQEDFKTLMRQKWSIVILNVIVFFIALAIFGVCIWIRFDLDFWEWVVEIDWYVIAAILSYRYIHSYFNIYHKLRLETNQTKVLSIFH